MRAVVIRVCRFPQPRWFDRKGNELGTVGQPDVYGNISLAPNGRSVAVNKTDPGSLNTDIWIYELQGSSSKRLTFNPGFNVIPIWSPDARRLVFASNRTLSVDLFIKNADGAQEEQSIVSDENDKFPYDWSRDEKYILYAVGRRTNLQYIQYVTLPEHKIGLFLKAPSVVRNAQFSPDRKWVADASNETGKWEIYVTSFPEARGRWQVSTGGGEEPRWRGDGKELFFLSSDGKMMAAPVTTQTCGRVAHASGLAMVHRSELRPKDSASLNVLQESSRTLSAVEAIRGVV
jgi:eukaryotic-like serine/threonine-protein kinase